jgi:hypothetical protein
MRFRVQIRGLNLGMLHKLKQGGGKSAGKTNHTGSRCSQWRPRQMERDRGNRNEKLGTRNKTMDMKTQAGKKSEAQNGSHVGNEAKTTGTLARAAQGTGNECRPEVNR